jgi:hypothetical protein
MKELVAQGKTTNSTAGQQAEYLRVSSAAKFMDMDVKEFRECLPEIPGVIKFSARGTRVPRAGLVAWAEQWRVRR